MNLPKVLKKYSKYSQITVDWLNFGSNGHIIQPANVVESFTKRAVFDKKQSYYSFKSIILSKKFKNFSDMHDLKSLSIINTSKYLSYVKSFKNPSISIGAEQLMILWYLSEFCKKIYSDAGMNSITGNESWGCVVDNNSLDLLPENLNLLTDMNIENKKLRVEERHVIKVKFDDVKSQQNNGGELLAFVAALRIGLELNYDQIKIDSELLHKWWSKGIINPKTLAKMDSNKKKYIFESVLLRKKFEEKGGQIIKISGKDNLADLGFHKG
jgi:hypothetical protein